ncbi:MAG: hypothetical protein ACN4E6_01595 [Qipengyuania pacifica]
MPFKSFEAPAKFQEKSFRNGLFKHLANAPIWQDAGRKNTSDVCRRKNLAAKELKTSRGEAFFGAVIGSCTALDEWTADNRRLFPPSELGSPSIYMVNDVNGPSSYRPWSGLFENFEIGVQSKYAESLIQLRTQALLALLNLLKKEREVAPPDEVGIRQLAFGDVDMLLQCNINIYKSSDQLSWHRDDTDLDGQPTTNTFHPAAVTWLLAARTYAREPEIRLVDPIGDEVINIGSKERAKNVVRGIGSESLFGISGASYQRGVHTATTGWASAHPEKFERMSFNFRLVRPDTWQRVTGTAP